MSQVELDGYPNSGWAGSKIVSRLVDAEAALRSSLQLNPSNRTANQRLGMISMLRGDFLSAAAYLEKANQEAPNHRGIIKSLGYCYVWSGNLEKAHIFLSKIPEAGDELDVYVWWWGVQGRDDLSANASLMISSLSSASQQ
jgi:tetratricopeptide (TPR) repeat protein